MRQRVRIRHTKTGDLVFLSHHDMMRLWERALRRSGLPIAFTEGFNPRPRYAIPLALGLGIASRDEIFEVEFSSWVTAGDVRTRLAGQLPPEVAILDLSVVGPGERGQVDRVDYELRLPPGSPADLGERLERVCAQPRIDVVRERNGRTVDLKPYLAEARLEGDVLRFTLRVLQEGTGRPEEFCHALGYEMAAVRPSLTKVRMHLRSAERSRSGGGKPGRRPPQGGAR